MRTLYACQINCKPQSSRHSVRSADLQVGCIADFQIRERLKKCDDRPNFDALPIEKLATRQVSKPALRGNARMRKASSARSQVA